MYTKYVGDKPYQYRYGESWRAMQLMVDGGYDTPEEAKAAWEAEQDANKVFCTGCGEKQNYYITRQMVKVKIRGTEFTAPEYVARCLSCKKEVYVSSVSDMNASLRERYYEEAKK
jgi:hypothetical protein